MFVLAPRWRPRLLTARPVPTRTRRQRPRFRPAAEALEDRVTPSTFTVSRVADDAASGSLRWAIQQANANPGPDTIAFNLPGPGVHTIQPLSALPALTDPVLLDGWSQPGYAGAPLIELDGSRAGGNVTGLVLSAANCTVRGLVVNRFSFDGIEVAGGGNDVLQGNYVGTDPTGTTGRGNGRQGVLVTTGGNTIGGTAAGAGNVISGNLNDGLQLAGTAATGNVVQGNFIGTDPSGTLAVGNGRLGVLVNFAAANNTVGGTAAGARNVISGNHNAGIQVADPNTTGNVVQGNSIGTNAAGTAALGNAGDGVLVSNGTANNTIGGAAAGAANVIAGNAGDGIGLFDAGTTNNVIQGNFVGSDPTGTKDLGNGGDGVDVGNGAPNNQVGGPAGGNVIAFNRAFGVAVTGAATTGTSIRGNSIFGNGQLGIDLGADGVTSTTPAGPRRGRTTCRTTRSLRPPAPAPPPRSAAP